MSLSRDEAAQTLREMTLTERQSADLARYRHSAPFFYWWGIFFLVAYGATGLWPLRAPLIWTIGAPIGVAGQIVIARYFSHSRNDWRWGAASLILSAYAAGALSLMWPVDGLRMGTFFPLLGGAIYAMAGLLFGLRLVITGLVIMAAALLGFFFLRDMFAYWIAAVVGGALILTGYWLQKA